MQNDDQGSFERFFQKKKLSSRTVEQNALQVREEVPARRGERRGKEGSEILRGSRKIHRSSFFGIKIIKKRRRGKEDR